MAQLTTLMIYGTEYIVENGAVDQIKDDDCD
jgi:hypothetical protein